MYQHCLPWGRLTEHAQSEHRQNVCMRKRESERERSRRREKPIIFNNKECHIKGRTSTALQKCVAYEIRPGTMRHAGMHDFYQFNYWNLNLRQRQGAETPPLSFERKGFVKAIIDAGPKLGQNVAHVSSPSGSWMETPCLKIERGSFGDGWCPQTYCRISLTSVVSLFLIEENSPSMGLGVILKGAKC